LMSKVPKLLRLYEIILHYFTIIIANKFSIIHIIPLSKVGVGGRGAQQAAQLPSCCCHVILIMTLISLKSCYTNYDTCLFKFRNIDCLRNISHVSMVFSNVILA
jgi:hypothetical protein